MRILITGVTGSVGPYLVDELLHAEEDPELWGLSWGPCDPAARARLERNVRVMECDVTDDEMLARALADSRPEIVYHLAAMSSVGASWSSPVAFLEVNAIGTARLFAALRRLDLRPRTAVVTSGEVYGRVEPSDLPLHEDASLRPATPYGASKAAQDLIAFQQAADGFPVVRLRPFNHLGPGQLEGFVASDFARQVAEAEAGLRPPRIAVGPLEPERDFTDVRDVVRAYRLAATGAPAGSVFNVCSGRPVPIRHLLDGLLAQATRSIEVVRDPELLRPVDVPVLFGDPSRLERATGWRAEIPLESSLADLLAWWRERVAAGTG